MAIVKSNTSTTVYSDFNVNFDINPITGDLLKVTGASSVIQALMNLVQINYYEKPFHPEIGSNVRKLLFENIDPIVSNALAKEIEVLVQNFEPRVNILSVVVTPDYDNNGYNVQLTVEILSINNSFVVTSFLQRLR
jgi:hypothetical protein